MHQQKQHHRARTHTPTSSSTQLNITQASLTHTASATFLFCHNQTDKQTNNNKCQWFHQHLPSRLEIFSRHILLHARVPPFNCKCNLNYLYVLVPTPLTTTAKSTRERTSKPTTSKSQFGLIAFIILQTTATIKITTTRIFISTCCLTSHLEFKANDLSPVDKRASNCQRSS